MTPRKPQQTADGRTLRVYDWSDVSRTVAAYLSGEDKPKSERLSEQLDAWRGGRRSRFYGCSADDMVGWLRGGYDLPPLDDHLELPPVREGRERRRRKSDDSTGDFDYVAYVNGESDYYSVKDRFRAAPGINVEFSYTFAAGVNHALIAGYGRWVGQAVQSLRSHGFDVALSLYSETRNRIPGEEISKDRIILNRFGEIGFQQDWSVIFSPAGYRGIVFAVYCLAAEREGKRVSYSYGSVLSDRWGVTYDAETRTIRITCSTMSFGERIPDHELTTQLAEIQERIG